MVLVGGPALVVALGGGLLGAIVAAAVLLVLCGAWRMGLEFERAWLRSCDEPRRDELPVLGVSRPGRTG